MTKKISFTKLHKNTKFLGINLMKGVKNYTVKTIKELKRKHK